MVKYFLLFFLVTIFSCKKEKVNLDENENLKSIKNSISQFSSRPYDSIKNEKRIDQTLRLIDDIDNDSLKIEALFSISLYFLENEDSLRFIQTNHKTLSLSQQLRDTSKIAESYWDLAQFYYNNNEVSKAFYNYSRAQQLYEKKQMANESGKMLLSMAILQKNIKDYTGSEFHTFKAIETFETVDNVQSLYSCYNNLGIIYNELEEYPKALDYHESARKYEERFKEERKFKQTTLNNIGVIYQNMDDHLSAIEYFNKGLEDVGLYQRNPRLFAMLLDNLAYSQFRHNKKEKVLEKFEKALKIRDSISHESGIVISKMRISEYFLANNDSIKAKLLLNEANSLAKETNNYRDYLRTLFMSASIDKNKGAEGFKEYIRVSDSLQGIERATRNKFTGILYETDKFIAKNNKLTLERQWMITGFSGLLLLFISVSVSIILRKRNRELVLIQQQQKTNEEIYDLLIESQIKVEEGQEKEKKRISRELHDGILSQFFGVRLNLEILEGQIDPASIEQRNNYHYELKLLENEIRKVSHQLNSDFLSSEKSFVNMIEDLLRQQEKIGDFEGNLIVKKDIEWENFSPKEKINFYRVIQEALHNINKHASAQKVAVVLSKNEREVLLSIADDGRGFQTESVSDGIGITNMKSRVLDLKGSISFDSGNEGTKVIIKIPNNAS